MKVGTFGLPLVLGLQFHSLKKGILPIEAPLLLVLVNSSLTLEGQRERACNEHFMYFRNIIERNYQKNLTELHPFQRNIKHPALLAFGIRIFFIFMISIPAVDQIWFLFQIVSFIFQLNIPQSIDPFHTS